MRLHKSSRRAGYPPAKFIPLVAALVIMVALLAYDRPTQAQPVDPDAEISGRPGVAPQQVPQEEDARLRDLRLIAGGAVVTPTPAFDPDTTRYVATIEHETVNVSAVSPHADAVIDRITVAGETTVLDSPSNLLDTNVDLVEGAITPFSLRVMAEDGVTTGEYRIDFSRPAEETVPDITIESSHTQYIVGFDLLEFTLTREGNVGDLDVTLNLDQTQEWLTTTSFTVTFEAGETTATHSLSTSDFSADVTQSGLLIATLDPVDGYDTSGARSQVEVFSQEEPAVTVALEKPAYTFDEDVGEAKVVLVARAAPGLPYVPGFYITALSEDHSATAGTAGDPLSDYLPISTQLSFNTSDFQEDDGSLVANKEVSVAIFDDDLYEGDESFYLHIGPAPGVTQEVAMLDAEGNRCSNTCASPYTVTIRDNDPIPTITIFSLEDSYLVGWGNLRFKITRTGDLSESLDVTVNLQQTQPWLSNTSWSVAFDVDDDEASLELIPTDFSGTVTESGDLTATVSMVDGYDTSAATATVRVYPYDGSLTVRVSLDSPSYTVPEDAGEVNVQLVARPQVNLPFVPTFFVSVSTDAGTATSPADYLGFSRNVEISNADFALENGRQVAHVDAPVAIINDNTYEGDETFYITLQMSPGLPSHVIFVDPEGNDCASSCETPYPVTIIEDDPLPPDLMVGLQHTLTGALTRDDEGRDEYTFNGVAGTQYIIEVKHPLRYVDPDVPTDETQPRQIPGYLVDPSILEIYDGQDLDVQVLGEHDQGGFALNWARAFFTPAASGTYRIAVGAGAQDRSALGGYTISIRIDDHADDFRTDPNIVLRPDESITASIDSDVGLEDLGLNESYWGVRGIEMLDDRDVIRFEISDEGTYQLDVTNQPTGVGIRYVWDHKGNLFARSLDNNDQPVASAQYEYEPGAYYVEIGTPFESEGNTGQYTLTLDLVQN